ncbi:MAG: 2-C-methyl-D-erythritol 4-phosphate cytidylyltransferase [Actinomycetes bacterium]
MSTAAIVPAAGRGERLGAGGPKALRQLAGVPMLAHAVRALAAADVVTLVVVAAPPDRVDDVRRLLRDEHADAGLDVVAGGPSRTASVRAALAVLPPEVTTVLVHDAARPLAPSSLAEAVAAAVAAGADAAIPVVPVTDTVKTVDGDLVTATIDRSALRSVQTPQGFRREVLERAHRDHEPGGPDATDDAGMVERLGLRVVVVPGHDEAFKVTRPLDLLLAETVLARRGSAGG